MDKYFALIQLKKQKIKKSDNEIQILNAKIKVLSNKISNLSSEQCNEIMALEEITCQQKERNIKDNTNVISFIILIASIIINYLLINIGVSLLIGGIINTINLVINRIIIKKTSKLYETMRKLRAEEIERKNKKIEKLQKEMINLEQQKNKLYEQKNKLQYEINQETEILHLLMDKIIEDYSVLLDKLIIQEIENNSNPEHELEIKRLRELIENNTKSA